MEEENIIHLKFNYGEALNSKKDLLYSQKSLLVMDRSIGEISALKEKKAELASKLQKKMRDLLTNVRGIEKAAPKVKIPKILKDEYNEEKDEPFVKKSLIKKDLHKEDIESQIKDIQEKLKSIGN